MARSIDLPFSDDDEFPDLDALMRQTKTRSPRKCLRSLHATDDSRESKTDTSLQSRPARALTNKASTSQSGQDKTPATISTVRRRRLGPVVDNHLLRPWNEEGRGKGARSLFAPSDESPQESGASRRRLRTRISKAKPIPTVSDTDTDLDADISGPKASWGDASEFLIGSGPESEADDTATSFWSCKSPPRIESKPQRRGATKPATRGTIEPSPAGKVAPGPDGCLRQRSNSQERKPRAAHYSEPINSLTSDITKSFAQIDITSVTGDEDVVESQRDHRDITPPLTPTRKQSKTLVSPKKLGVVPSTPHRPSMDMFWSQEFVDDWNDEHSPKKLFLPPVVKSPAKERRKGSKAEGCTARGAKKLFEQSKHEIAEAFLRELDNTITHGKLEEMAKATGGIQITWNNKLNTTAGRANWRRETVRTSLADGTEASVTHRHHASIELAGKVIDDDHRLLNVIAHEFCHLANFMVSGVTGNPHGREFKEWAAKCTATFGHRGIDVTTKHSYDIDFKYVWECTSCGTEFKRHSKSINPERHRCGVCKDPLVQTKPVPRKGAKESEYQKFVREHMRAVKDENPQSPQKDMMRLVAQKWSQQAAGRADAESRTTPTSIAEDLDDVAGQLEVLSL